MTVVDRESVLSNAKYLRNVRPVDPEEICEYVAGQPHPAVVRQVLREEATDLGMVEREDGTFVPVPDDPVSPLAGPVEGLPDRYDRLLDEALVEHFDTDWHRGESGHALRDTVRRFKDDYFRGRSVTYDETTALGYAVYHLADYYAVVQYALSELAEAGLLSRDLRVLDVGAGVGGPMLGLADFLPDDALVDYHAVEPSGAADLLARFADELGPNRTATVHRTTVESFDMDEAGPFDLVLFANVLSELDDPEAVARSALDALAPDGTLVALAPADRETAIGLREVERALADDGPATVFSPTVRLWPDERPTDRGWSFTAKPDLTVPAVQKRLDGAGNGDGEFVNVDVQYAYSLLRSDDTRRVDVTASVERFARMADMDDHLTRRIDLLAAKLSHDLTDAPDANPLFKVSDGSEAVDHYAVLTRETALNRDLATADYGDLLTFEGVLALWNDDEGAYNLVVDEDTVVDAVPF